ncbi:hypothetical protein QR680_010466 [Steinernema hermaphroditum]|uniref:Uncharacterized protein n=1 Tax=Steinernema hermaphroditum TaxID=289476 RepID=A0AA39IQB7_9BILA|nr:hypothetical protein QR680_010466 [Steinernema hermaphroditum]
MSKIVQVLLARAPIAHLNDLEKESFQVHPWHEIPFLPRYSQITSFELPSWVWRRSVAFLDIKEDIKFFEPSLVLRFERSGC